MTCTAAQLAALLRLRWTMVRSRRARLGLIALAVAVLALLALAPVGGRLLPASRVLDTAVLMPTALLAYAALAVVGPLAAGGGGELFPAEDLSPMPVRPSTMYLASLSLAPLNIAWIAQTAALLTMAGYVCGSWQGLPTAEVLMATFVIAATTVGQTAGWWIVGLRATRAGRRACWAAGALLAAAAGWAWSVGVSHVLDRAPTRQVVVALVQGAHGHYGSWTLTLLALVAVSATAVRLGGGAAAYALRRPTSRARTPQERVLPRRPMRRSSLAQLIAVDRASVWRAPALRRGVLVIGLLPGLATSAAHVEWPTIALTGGLVAAGSGLLFGVNAFCLDAGGALWLASQPSPPRLHLLAKAWVIAEVCLACCGLSVTAAAVRAPSSPTAPELVAVAGSVVTCIVAVVAICLRASVTRPHKAQLNGPRDTPAPHGAMAVYSMRLALATTVVGMTFAASARAPHAWVPASLWLAALVWFGARGRRAFEIYADFAIRSRVTVTVAHG